MTKREQRGIQSLEAAGKLLIALARSPSAMALKDLARDAEMSPSKAHPYLVSWAKLGLVQQDEATGRYDLGDEARRLGITAIQRTEPVKIVLEELSKLDVGDHWSTAISAWGNMGPTIIHFLEADYPLQVHLRSGTVLSIANTAAGNVFAAWMPRSVIETALPLERYRFSGAPGPVRWTDIEKIAEKVRKQGVARSIGQAVPGVNSICAPVLDADGKITLAVSIMKPGGRADAGLGGEIARAARLCAERASRRLGWAQSDGAGLRDE